MIVVSNYKYRNEINENNYKLKWLANNNKKQNENKKQGSRVESRWNEGMECVKYYYTEDWTNKCGEQTSW